MEESKQVIFKLGSEEYGISILYVNAIEKYTNIIPVPNAPGYIEGIINLRGEVIPVYSLRNKFHKPANSINDDSKLIVTKSNGIVIAFQVDSVQEIIEIEDANIIEPPAIVKSEETAYIDKIANFSGRLIIILNLDGILSSSERKNIEKIMNDQ